MHLVKIISSRGLQTLQFSPSEAHDIFVYLVICAFKSLFRNSLCPELQNGFAGLIIGKLSIILVLAKVILGKGIFLPSAIPKDRLPKVYLQNISRRKERSKVILGKGVILAPAVSKDRLAKVYLQNLSGRKDVDIICAFRKRARKENRPSMQGFFVEWVKAKASGLRYTH